MNIKQFFTHRLRDFDAAIRSEHKIKMLLFVTLRILGKAFRIKEEKLQGLIPQSKSSLYNNTINTRKNTLDFLFCSKYYEAETTNYIMNNKGKVFIDIGGHIGRFAILASKSFEKVIVFEPHPANYKALTGNVNQNNISNVTVINTAVSDEKGAFFMSDITTNTGWVYLTKEGKTEIKRNTLASLIAEQQVAILDIETILIDAEGHELEVLRGATEVLKNGNAKIILESFDLTEIEKFLAQFNYLKVKLLDASNYLFEKKN